MRMLLTRSYNTVLIIIIVPLTLFPLCRLLIQLPDTYTVNFSTFCCSRLIGKLTVLFPIHLPTTNTQYLYRRTEFSSQFKSKVTHSCQTYRPTHGTPITSRSHIHLSHSQTSRLLTSSLFLGDPVPHTTQCR